MKIEGAVAVVTGGGSGLGLATTKRLLDAGANVVVIDLKGDAAIAELGDRAKFVHADVTDPESLSATLDVAESLGPIRINVNCAGGRMGYAGTGRSASPLLLARIGAPDDSCK